MLALLLPCMAAEPDAGLLVVGLLVADRRAMGSWTGSKKQKAL